MVSDEDLLECAAAGDGEAFAVFYRRHVDAITTFVRRRVATPELAFDLTAEAFASAVAHVRRFDREKGSARGWLFAIAHNEVRMAHRRGAVEHRARRRLGCEPIALDDEALTRVEERVDDGALTRALADLPVHEREAVEARVLGEQDYEEIAAVLRCSPLVVRKRVSRGLRRLRDEVTR